MITLALERFTNALLTIIIDAQNYSTQKNQHPDF